MSDSSDKTVKVLRQGQLAFGRFGLKEKLGEGGMGEVWLAWDENLEQDVALKFLNREVRHDPEAISDLKIETRRSRELTHPNIVRIHDFHEDKEAAAISMECVDGKALHALKADKDEGCFDVAEIELWTKQLCAALAYAHGRAKVVHRDLKPGNLLVDSAGNLKVTDFGIARSLSDSVTRITLDRGNSGTLGYMSFQQLMGQKPSSADDIYAFGATIYHLLAGKPPFYTGDIAAQVEKAKAPTMTERREDLGLKGASIPEVWENTISSCLDKNVTKRPASMIDVAEKLGMSISNDAMDAASYSATDSSSNRGLIGILALIAALVALAVALFKEDGSERAEDFKITPFVIDTNSSVGIGTNGTTPFETNKLPFVKSVELQPAVTPQREPLTLPNAVHTNSLGVPFVSIPGLNASFAIYETRVGDFSAFVDATGHDASTGMYRHFRTFDEFEQHSEETGFTIESGGVMGSPRYYGQLGGWNNPGFHQNDEYPVVGMSRDDAISFCAWLTTHERKQDLINLDQEYRLPSDYEWSVAVGLNEKPDVLPKERLGTFPNIFPWGTDYPPPAGAGNLRNLEDWFQYSAPVGMYKPNTHGLFDMSGNVMEWCLDDFDENGEYGVVRGAAFDTAIHETDRLWSSERNEPAYSKPHKRNVHFGFRVVLSKVGESQR